MLQDLYTLETATLYCFPGGASGKELTCQYKRCMRHKFDPWVRTIPWRRTWQPTTVILPEESHGQRSLAGYIQPIGLCTDSNTAEMT